MNRNITPMATSAHQALAVLLEHPEGAADCRLAARMLQVSREWGQVVKQCGAGHGVISISVNSLHRVHHLSRLISMLRWMCKYPGVVGSVCVETYSTEGETEEPCIVALLQLSLANAALQNCGSWKLRSFRCTDADCHLIRALPGSTLTRLRFDNLIGTADTVGTALAQLTQLKTISMSTDDQNTLSFPDSMFRGFSALTTLTSISVACHASISIKNLPDQLRELDIYVGDGLVGTELPEVVIDIANVTALQRLSVSSREPEVALLPVHLQSLTLNSCVHGYSALNAFAVSGLSALTNLSLDGSDAEAPMLGSITVLKQLQSFRISVERAGPMSRIRCNALTELGRLHVECDFAENTEALLGLLANISCATTLTALKLDFPGDVGVHGSDGSFFWTPLAELTNLCSLELRDVDGPGARGVSALSRLTKLTCLELGALRCSPYGVLHMQALLQKLTGLEELSLHNYSTPGSPFEWDKDCCLLPLLHIGQMTGLRKLIYLFEMTRDDAQHGLSYLTGLKRLTCLIGFEKARFR